MNTIEITFPDGYKKRRLFGVRPQDIAIDIGYQFSKNAFLAIANGRVVKMNDNLENNTQIQFLTWDDPNAKELFWHSSAHLLAEAIQFYYPNAKFGIGPAIQNGFYYDIDFGKRTFSEDDFKKIERKMEELAAQDNRYIKRHISKAEALKHYQNSENPYKVELINKLNDSDITFYQQGTFTDLCKGPHLASTGSIKAVKLLNISGAYWLGDDKNPQMTRIYGISFPDKKKLERHLELLEEAKKRDHRKLGKELELFMFSNKVGAGLPIWLEKGAILRNCLESFLKKEQIKRGYKPVITPHIGKKELYITSGHYEKYGKDSFQPIKTPRDGEEFLLKPMNCPHHCEIYGHKPRSYRDLPIRFAEFGTVYRYEQSGELHGLTRVRGFTQDDAHIFCTHEQLKEEFLKVLDLTTFVLKKLDFNDYQVRISAHDPDNRDKYIGSDENWTAAENAIKEAVNEADLEAKVAIGEAAFYGPKLDFLVKDALGRSWQLGTIQVDYNLPERFKLEYVGADNKNHTPIMIHRAPFGSMERFIGVLTEHCNGAFPFWLAPVQVIILPISDKLLPYALGFSKLLEKLDVRNEIDARAERLNRKVRDAEMQKIPFQVIVGEKEEKSQSVSVRKRGNKQNRMLSIETFLQELTLLL